MNRYLIFVGYLGLVGCHSSLAIGSDCTLSKISVTTTDPSRNEVYAGKAQTIEVQFRNENAPKTADVYPYPQVTVRNLSTAKYCDIKDGNGIWSGKSVYLDKNERVLVLNEYSGASDTLAFYDTRTCRRLSELDVSSRRWEIAEDRIRIGQQCGGEDFRSCHHIKEIILDKSCLARESKAITIK